MSFSRKFVSCRPRVLLKVGCSTHSDTALEMLRNGGGASAEEENILGKFEWNKNEAVVHWDEKVSRARAVES